MPWKEKYKVDSTEVTDISGKRTDRRSSTSNQRIKDTSRQTVQEKIFVIVGSD